MERAHWQVYLVQTQTSGHWDNPRRFDSWFEAKEYLEKIKSIIEEVKQNPNSEFAILGFTDVRWGEDRGY